MAAAAMSASPNNPSPESASKELTKELSDSATFAQQISPGSTIPPGHEALQALLAFSSLHEQIRQRRARQLRAGNPGTTDVWGLEQFVLDEVLQLVAERALSITGADGVAIALAEQDAIVCRGSAGIIAPDAGVRLDPNSGFSGACLRTSRIVRCDDTESDPRVNVEACRRLGARSLVAVPISGLYGVIGLLEAFSNEEWGFNDCDVRSLNLLAELILAAMRPEEEDRLAEISRRVVAGEAVVAQPSEVPVSTDKEGRADSAVRSETVDKVPETAAELRSLFAGLQPSGAEQNFRPRLAVVLLLVLAAMALGTGMWWKSRYRSQPPSMRTEQTPAAVAAPEPGITDSKPKDAKGPDASLVMPGEPPPPLSSVSQEKLSVLPKVTGIEHLSSPDSTTVIVDLQDQVQYEAHHLSDPERIYFDLHDTALAPELFRKTIEVGDKLLTRIRIAQPAPGVTRVVLETRGAPKFSVRLESTPLRLVVEVRSPDAVAPKTKPGSLSTEPPLLISPTPTPAGTEGISEGKQPAKHGRAVAPRFRIVLDAGHGGWDLGTVGRKGLLEKDLVLDIAERLGKLVQKSLGAEVVYTRANDAYVALEKRAEIANLSHADLFVSIHANYSSDSSARGVETYYTNTYSSVKARTRELDASTAALENINWTNVDIREKVRESRRFATTVQRSLYGALASENPGLRNRGVKEATYVVLTGTTMPAILAEVSFVSSPEDEEKLESTEYRQQIADALYQGVTHYAAAFHHLAADNASGKPAGQ